MAISSESWLKLLEFCRKISESACGEVTMSKQLKEVDFSEKDMNIVMAYFVPRSKAVGL